MNVKQIIIEHLKSIGADGLCTDDCGCGIDDLAPCECWCPDCVPARKTIADEAGEFHDIGDTVYTPLEPGEGREETYGTKCRWLFIVPGVWRAGCNDTRLLSPSHNQVKAKGFAFCPYCGRPTEFREYCDPPHSPR